MSGRIGRGERAIPPFADHLAGENDVGADDLLPLASGNLALVGRYGVSSILEPHTPVQHRLPAASAFRNVFVARYAPLP
jgi:hypothetical protein